MTVFASVKLVRLPQDAAAVWTAVAPEATGRTAGVATAVIATADSAPTATSAANRRNIPFSFILLPLLCVSPAPTCSGHAAILSPTVRSVKTDWTVSQSEEAVELD
jgi:hypothetical protein